MNNTLTGLGLALVLALLAALIGPWFVNWTAYRDDFAAQASALVGAPVEVKGAVDARLLPSPYVRFRAISAGTGATRASIDEVEIELAFAPLLRGEVKAERVKLVRPRLGVEVAADGGVRTAFSSAGAKGGAERVSFDRAEIVDGLVHVTAPSGRWTLDRISGVAEAGSLAGPFRFEGAAGPGGRRVEARLSTGRADASGAMRIKLAIKSDVAPETFEADGALTLAGKPVFDGKAALARPEARNVRGGSASGDEAVPWRIAADVKGGAAAFRLDNLDIAFGPDDRGVRLGGSAAVTLRATPRVELSLASRQVDLDRMVGENRPKSPAGVIEALVTRLGTATRPPVEGRLSIDLRGLVLAGDVVQDVRAEIETQDGGWRIRSASAVLPGETKTAISGAVIFAGADPAFFGPVSFETADLAGFRRWLAGGEIQPPAPVRRLSLRGDVAARPDEVAIEDAELATDAARSTGRVSWRAAERPDGRARVEAALESDRLDLDALGLDRLFAQALSGRGPDVLLALDARALSFSGVSMSGVSIDGSLGRDGIDLKRLAIRDAAGAAISGAGSIGQGASGAQGRLGFDVQAPRLAPLLTLARAFGAPEPVLAALRARSTALAPLKLAVEVESDGKGRRFAVRGDAAGGRIDARLSVAAPSLEAETELEIRLTSPDGRRLAAIAGLDLSPVAEARGGELWAKLAGAPAAGMTGEGRFAGLGVDLSARGKVALAPVAGLSAEGEAALKSGDVAPLLAAVGRLAPTSTLSLPVDLKANAALDAEGVRLDGLSGAIAGRPIRGRLAAPYDLQRPIAGEIALEELPLAAFMALAFSPEALSGGEDRRSVWPSAAFGPSPARGLVGRVAVTASRAPLGGGRSATDARFAIALKRGAVAIEGISAELEGGRLTGSVNVARSNDDATASVALLLEGARVERVIGLPREASPLLGALDLKVEAQGTGRSLAGLVGSLTGAGSATLTDGSLRRLDVGAIERLEPRVEAGLPLEAPKIADALTRDIDGAHLKLARAVAPFTLSGGVLRTGAIASDSPVGTLGGAATLDLRRLALDADLTLKPNRPDAPQIGLSFDGPLARPVRRIDATDFTNWLSVRAVERETRRIEAMEADIRERARIARLRAEEDRKRAEEEKRRLEEERRKAEMERRKREAEARALVDTLPLPSFSNAPGLPSALDITPPGAAAPAARGAPPPAGVFGGPEAGRPAERGRSGLQPDALTLPQSILPPAAVGSPGR
ncbi:AsmA family protein [Hansschlegelia zhihuaiae]|uniref:AsmA family protein n=1 Tax=Hansschlegelia zhihuaiae TaxID=405005 RepID=A0A4V1KIV8_9HYPH|nr:AsmA family protein [Hansschlegelia zhihuaiae]RXF72042.1 AsmA family protein [Hansschlegelia zhihuaiae]